jgi:hypothetical protein
VKTVLWAAAAVLFTAVSPALADDVPGGVYDCYGPSLAAGPNIDISLHAGQFGVLSPGKYMSRNGKTGHFKFDGLTLTMTDGPLKGIRYQKVPDFWSFRILRETGEMGPFSCPRVTAKDPGAPNKW